MSANKPQPRYSSATFYGSGGGSRCGYCKSPDGMVTTGMTTPRLTTQDYQDLIDRGWRRSGTYCYRPIMKETCCPLYTIRCDANECRLSSSQRRLLRRVRAFLLTGVRPKTGKPNDSHHKSHTTTQVSQAVAHERGDVPASGGTSVSTRNAEKGVKPTKAKYLRWQRKLEHFKTMAEKRNCTVEDILKEYEIRRAARLKKNDSKTLEELIECEPKEKFKHHITVKIVRSSPPSEEFKASMNASHKVYKSYQHAVHGDSASDCTLEQWQRFLVDSPLLATSLKASVPDYDQLGYGSFHMQYWLDSTLVAVGVIDILPNCLSSVYLYYDPQFAFLQLGTYTALREIALVRQLSRVVPQLKFYYMGFFINTCPKMRYKGKFQPSYLACPETLRWVPLERCLPIINRTKYSRLYLEDLQAKDEDAVGDEAELERLVVLDTKSLMGGATNTMPYGDLKRLLQNREMPMVKEFGVTVGRKCVQRMLLTLW